MAIYIVECVNIDTGSKYDDCRCIESIGFSASGAVELFTPAEVYDIVEGLDETVVVEHNGERTEVIGATHGKTKYVRTEPNDKKDDNLLKQPTC